MGPRLKSGSED